MLAALAAGVVARLTSGDVHDAARVVSVVALIMWSLLEIARGANWFRRILGVVVLASVVL